MNFSLYFLLASAAVLVISVQQSGAATAARAQAQSKGSGTNSDNPGANHAIQIVSQKCKENVDARVFVNATKALCNGYIKGINLVATAQKKANDGLSAADKMILNQPDAAFKALQQAFEDALSSLFDSARPVFQGLGAAKAFSNDGSRAGLENASRIIQKAGPQDTIHIALSFVDQGKGSGGQAAQMLMQSARTGVNMGFAAAYNNIEESIESAINSLKNATRSPARVQIVNHNDAAAARDSDVSDAIKHINDSGNKAKQRGANATLVNDLCKLYTSSLGDIAKVAADGKLSLASANKTSQTDRNAAVIAFWEDAKDLEYEINVAASRIYVGLGDLRVKSGNQTNTPIQQSIEAIEHGKTEHIMGIESAGNMMGIGLRYNGSAPNQGFEAAYQSESFGKLAFVQRMVTSADNAFQAL